MVPEGLKVPPKWSKMEPLGVPWAPLGGPWGTKMLPNGALGGPRAGDLGADSRDIERIDQYVLILGRCRENQLPNLQHACKNTYVLKDLASTPLGRKPSKSRARGSSGFLVKSRAHLLQLQSSKDAFRQLRPAEPHGARGF